MFYRQKTERGGERDMAVRKKAEGEFTHPGLKLQADLWFRMRTLALKQRRKVWELTNEAIDDYLKKHERE